MSMGIFKFGARVTRVNRKGEQVDVGEYGLHIECPWRIVGAEAIIVASEDRHYPEDEESDWEECARIPRRFARLGRPRG